MTVEVDGSVIRARFRNRDRTPKTVILAVTMRDDHVQAIDCASLKDSDQHLLTAVTALHLGICELMKKFRCRGHKAEARQTYTALFQEKSSIHKWLPHQNLRRP